MKKQVVGYMAIGLLAMAMVVQAQPASRQGRNSNPGDSIERVSPMRRMDSSRGMQGGMRQMPQGRSGVAPFGGRSMQRGGAMTVPGSNRMQRSGALSAQGNRKMERGGVVPGYGFRNRQGGLQRGLQPVRRVDPEKRIENEVDRMKKTLDLSSDQVKKITSIKKKQAKKEIKAYKKSQKKMEARRKKNQAPNDKIKSVLTEEQKKKWESSRQGVRPGAGSRNQR